MYVASYFLISFCVEAELLTIYIGAGVDSGPHPVV